MATANLDLDDGTKVTIDGSAEEIAKILKAVEARTGKKSTHPKPAQKSSKTTRQGQTARIREVIAENYFSRPRQIKDIIERLGENGHIYTTDDLATPLRRLVKNKELRRKKQDGQWIYINP